MSTGSVSAQGRKTGAAAETVQKRQKQHTKRMCLKLSAVVASASADDTRRVSEGVQKYSVQYKGYNMIGVTTVEGGTTRGTTALLNY
jgi:hypothetical protein